MRREITTCLPTIGVMFCVLLGCDDSRKTHLIKENAVGENAVGEDSGAGQLGVIYYAQVSTQRAEKPAIASATLKEVMLPLAAGDDALIPQPYLSGLLQQGIGNFRVGVVPMLRYGTPDQKRFLAWMLEFPVPGADGESFSSWLDNLGRSGRSPEHSALREMATNYRTRLSDVYEVSLAAPWNSSIIVFDSDPEDAYPAERFFELAAKVSPTLDNVFFIGPNPYAETGDTRIKAANCGCCCSTATEIRRQWQLLPRRC